MSDDQNPDKSKLELELEEEKAASEAAGNESDLSLGDGVAESDADDSFSSTDTGDAGLTIDLEDDTGSSGLESAPIKQFVETDGHSDPVGMEPPLSASKNDDISAGDDQQEAVIVEPVNIPPEGGAFDQNDQQDMQVENIEIETVSAEDGAINPSDFEDLDDLQDLVDDEFDDGDTLDEEDDYDFYADEAKSAHVKKRGVSSKVIVLGLLLVSAIGGGGYFYLSSQGSQPSNNNAALTAQSQPNYTAPGATDTSESADFSFANSLPQPQVAQNDASGLPQDNAAIEFDVQTPAFPTEAETMADSDQSNIFSSDDFAADNGLDLAQTQEPIFDDGVFNQADPIEQGAGLGANNVTPQSLDQAVTDSDQNQLSGDPLANNQVGDPANNQQNFEIQQAPVATSVDQTPPPFPAADPNSSISVTQQSNQALPSQPAGSAGQSQSAAPQQQPFDVSSRLKTTSTAQPDLFFDSGSQTPSAVAGAIGPREIDPVREPASRFVVVQGLTQADNQDAMVGTAKRALDLGRYESALELYNGLYAKNKRDPRILMGRAVSLQKTGRTNSAIQAYEELLGIDKNNAGAVVNLLGLLKEQYPSVAVRRLEELKDRFPDNPAIFAQLGVTEGGLGNYENAVKYLGIASSLEPSNAQHYFNMGIISERAGNSQDAIAFYQKALDIDAVYGGAKTLPRDTIYDRMTVLRSRR